MQPAAITLNIIVDNRTTGIVVPINGYTCVRETVFPADLNDEAGLRLMFSDSGFDRVQGGDGLRVIRVIFHDDDMPDIITDQIVWASCEGVTINKHQPK